MVQTHQDASPRHEVALHGGTARPGVKKRWTELRSAKPGGTEVPPEGEALRGHTAPHPKGLAPATSHLGQ